MTIFRIIAVVSLLVIFFPAKAQETGSPTFFVDNYRLEGDNPLGDELNELLVPYQGEHFGLDGLSAATDALNQAFNEQGFIFHRAILPPQTLDSGSVTIRIVRFNLGRVDIEGNQHFSDANILNSLPELTPGQAPNNQRLSRSLRIANQHNAKLTRISLRQGLEPDTIDASVKVDDRNPQSLFVALDNTGNEDTEDERLTLGYQHANLFDLDHTLTTSFTTSPADTEKASQFGVNYRIPLYSHGATLDFLVSVSDVDSGEVVENFDVSGAGTVFSAVYGRPILTDGSFNHDWSIGIQDKLFENDLSFAGTPIGSDIKSRPLELKYRVSNRWKSSLLNAYATVAANISGGSDNEDEDYELLRAGAEADWSVLRFGLGYSYFFSNQWRLVSQLDGQQSGDPLIPGEQFGVGGMSSLRGFEERSILGDNGYKVRIEGWAPPFGSSNIQLIGFIDAASLELENPQLGEDDSVSVSGAGLGLRWNWMQQFSLSIDHGTIVEGVGDQEDKDSKTHFSLVYRY